MRSGRRLYKLLFSVGAVSALFLSACTKNSKKIGTHGDQVLAKIAGQELKFGSYTLNISNDGSFDLLADLDIKQYQSSVKDSEGKEIESDARCLVQVVGKVSFGKPSSSFEIENAKVLAFKSISVDPPVTAFETCHLYADTLTRKKLIHFELVDFGSNYLALRGLFLHANENGKELFSATPHLAYKASHIGRDGFAVDYFVKANAQVNVTNMVLGDLAGQYQTMTGPRVDLTVNAKHNELFLTSPCGFLFKIKVAEAILDGEVLKATLLPTQIKGYEQSTTAMSAECSKIEAQIKSLSAGPVKMGYLSNKVTQDGLTSFLTLVLSEDAELKFQSVLRK